eukprot:UN02938
MSSPNRKSKKNTSSSRLDVDDYLHKKGEKWTKQNILLFVVYAVLMSLIPSYLYWGAYDYRPDGYIGIEYIVYMLTIGCASTGLLSAYTTIYVDCLHFLKTSSQSKSGEKQMRIFEAQSFWWTLFYVNAVFIMLFFLANFYTFKSSIPNIHFRYILSTISPSAAVHFWVNGTNKSNSK